METYASVFIRQNGHQSLGIQAVFSYTDDLVVIFDFKAILTTDE